MPEPANNLPVQTTSFVGRQTALTAVERLLTGHRLVTLTGPGGTGKTRLALQVAATVASRFSDGVWLIDLAAVNDGRLVLQRVASVLGVHEEPNRPLVTTLVAALQARQMLLILDNCEHLVAACAALAEALLPACPQVHVLASSREALGSPGEVIFRVPSLSLPEAAALPGDSAARHLLDAEAVCLFVDRARAVRPGFVLTAQNAAAVQQVCERLDGIPLAIELAAGQVHSLAVAQIAVRLDDRFQPQARSGHLTLPRQQTLRATIDWSYDLLDVGERVVLRRLAVLAGAWTGDLAAEICAGEGLEADALHAGLAALAAKSLVVEEAQAGEPRYRLLAIIRQYARDKLREAGEEEWARNRHLEVFLHLAEAAASQLRGAQQAVWLARLEAEHDNLRTALEWSMAREDTEAALRLGGALWNFWYVRSHLSEGRRWLEAALALGPAAATPWRAQALRGAGVLAYMQGDYPRAVGHLEASLEAQRVEGDPSGIARALNSLAAVLQDQGEYPRAQALFEESLALARGLGDDPATAATLGNLGLAAREQGAYDQAAALLDESLALFRAQEDMQGIANTLTNLGAVALYRGDATRADVLCREGLALWCELGDQAGMAQSLEQLAAVAGAQGQAARAMRLWGAAEALCQAIGAPLPSNNHPYYEGMLAAARQALDAPAFAAAQAAGRAWPREQALAEATRSPDTDSTGASAVSAL